MRRSHLLLLVQTFLKGEKRAEERDGYIVKRLKPFFTGRDMRTLKRSDVRAYIEKRKSDGVASSTINREIGLLSAAINYVRREWEWNIPNNVQGMRLKVPEGRVRYLTLAEGRRLIEVAEQHTRSPLLVHFIRLALNTGCRKNELLKLEWKKNELLKLEWNRVNLEKNYFLLEGSNTKNGRRRLIPLNAEARLGMLGLLRYRAEHCPGTPWVFARPNGARLQEIDVACKWLFRTVGIENFRIHDLRHTCAFWLVNKGVQLYRVKELLGHSTIKMTERYAHLAFDGVMEAVCALDSGHNNGHTEVKQLSWSNSRH